MPSAELADVRDRVARLERDVGGPVLSGGSGDPLTVRGKNSTGVQLKLGDSVCAGAIDSTTGLLTFIKATEVSDPKFLGIATHTIPAGHIGRVQVSGVAIARWCGTITGVGGPSAGSDLGCYPGSLKLYHSQKGAAKYLRPLNVGEKLIYVLIPHPTTPLIVDHDNHVDSTSVRELRAGSKGEDWVGHLHDQWKVLSTELQGERLGHALAYHGEHREGWAWGNVLDEYGGSGTFGWAKWANLVGFEDVGETQMNFWTQGRWNDGAGAVGPIYFAVEPAYELLMGDYFMGAMLWDGSMWRPSVRIQMMERRDCEPRGNFVFTGDCDCNCLNSPMDYQIQVEQIVGAYRSGQFGPGGSGDNYLHVMCCMLERENLIFRLLHVMDCCYGNFFQKWDNWFNTYLANAGGADIVTALIWCIIQIQTFHPVVYPNAPGAWPGMCPANIPPYNESYYKQNVACENHGGPY